MFISLLVPCGLLLLLVFFFLFSFRRKFKIAGVALITIVWINWCFECVPLNWGNNYSIGNFSRLKVLTWNIDGGEFDSLKVKGIVELIYAENPDIVYLAEDFNESAFSIDTLIREKMPYSSFPQERNGHVIYSKHLIENFHIVNVQGFKSTLRMHARVVMDNTPFDIYGIHLASNNYSVGLEDHHLDSIENYKDAIKYLLNMIEASKMRSQEIDAILDDIELHTSENVIIMGDFNDVSGSNPISKLQSKGFKDAWWEKEFGYGATIHFPLPYRIDHIMYDKGLKLRSIRKIDSDELSDHDALVAEFEMIN